VQFTFSQEAGEEPVLYEKGKMTFMKFNSGRWFNVELSIFLVDSYPDKKEE